MPDTMEISGQRVLPMLESCPGEGWKTNVLGALDILQFAGGRTAEGAYLCGHLGNAVHSRDSRLHTYRQQIDMGGPITVTHPEITRYFMTILEASELLIQAAAIGRDAEALVLDMGEPDKILAVAKQLIIHSHSYSARERA